MVMLYAISRSEIAYKLSEFCALRDTPAMVNDRLLLPTRFWVMHSCGRRVGDEGRLALFSSRRRTRKGPFWG